MSGIGNSVLGNNQFAYCFNNPVNLTDSAGNWPQWIKSTVFWIKDKFTQSVEEFAFGVIEDLCNYNAGNESEQAVFDANYFSCYKGALVVKTPFDASFSFGIIGLSTSQQTPDALKHEYGHTVQLKEMGLKKYIKEVAIPSLTINVLDRKGKLPYDYFSYPWEAEANELGGSNLTQDGPALPEDSYNSYWDLILLFFD